MNLMFVTEKFLVISQDKPISYQKSAYEPFKKNVFGMFK